MKEKCDPRVVFYLYLIGMVLILVGVINMYFFYEKAGHKTNIVASGVVEVGKKAPDFKLCDVDSEAQKEYALSDYRGKPVVILFGESFCGPCLAEMKDMNELYKKYKKDGLAVLAITKTFVDSMKQFKESNKIEFPILADDRGITFDKKYKIDIIPQAFFVDKQGIIKKITVGYSKERKESYEKIIREML